MVAGTGLFLLLGFQPALYFGCPREVGAFCSSLQIQSSRQSWSRQQNICSAVFLLSLRCVQAHRKTTKKPRTPCVPSALSVGRLVFFNILVAGTGLFLFTIFGIKSQLSHFLATFFVVIDIFSTFAIAQGAIRGV